MRIELEIDARNDSRRHRHALAADWITVSRHGRFQLRDRAEIERRHLFEKIRRSHGDDGEIAIVRDEFNRRLVFIRIAFALDREIATVAYDMRVRHDAIAIDDKAGADTALDRAGVPRRAIIRFNFRRRDANQTFLNLSVRLRLQDLARKQKSAEQKTKTIHEDEVGKMKQKSDKANFALFSRQIHERHSLVDFPFSQGESLKKAATAFRPPPPHFPLPTL